jgi:hypothetical protein
MEEHPALPFETMVPVQVVTVTRPDVTNRDGLVAICVRGTPRSTHD